MKELKIQPIKNGTVIDHIYPGNSVKVLSILRIPKTISSTVSVAMNVRSKYGKKDIVKVEDRELDNDEVDKIALIAPKATMNIIRDFEVVKKYTVELPDEIVGIACCLNPTCISNDDKETVRSRFKVISKDPPRIKCYYCEREPENIADHIL